MAGLLSSEHLIGLSLVIVSAACLTVLGNVLPTAWSKAVGLGLAALLVFAGLIVVFVDHAAAWAYLASAGFTTTQLVHTLPLQLCDAAIPVAALALITRKKVLVELTYFWGLAGSTQALITPDLSDHFPDYPVVEYYIAHGAVVAAACFLVMGLHERPRDDATKRVAIVTGLFVAFVLVADVIGDSNYMYLRSKPSQPTLLSLMSPWPWYLPEAAILAIGLLLMLAAPFRISAIADSSRRVLAIGSLIVGGLVPILVAFDFSVWAWTSWSPPAVTVGDRLSAITAALTFATLCLAALAALVAIMAYVVATQRPKLVLRITFPGRPANLPKFIVDSDRLIDLGDLDSGNLVADVEIENMSHYSARNPALRITMVGLSGLNRAGQHSEWSFLPGDGPATIARWDRGSAFSIHGTWTHELPALNFAGVTVVSALVKLKLEVVAEGYQHEIDIPVELQSRKDWQVLNGVRAAALGLPAIE